MLSVIPKLRIQESGGSSLDAKPRSDLGSLNFDHWPQNCVEREKTMQGQQKAPLKLLIIKKIVNVEEGQNQETIETRGYRVKELFHSMDWYHQLLEEPLLTWIMRITNLKAV